LLRNPEVLSPSTESLLRGPKRSFYGSLAVTTLRILAPGDGLPFPRHHRLPSAGLKGGPGAKRPGRRHSGGSGAVAAQAGDGRSSAWLRTGPSFPRGAVGGGCSLAVDRAGQGRWVTGPSFEAACQWLRELMPVDLGAGVPADLRSLRGCQWPQSHTGTGRSGQPEGRFITRPKSRTMRATRQLGLPPGYRRV
jgi:hypothetical protein